MTANLIVLTSDDGSTLQALCDACASGRLDARVVLVVSNERTSQAIDLAETLGIPALYHPLDWYAATGRTVAEYELDLAANVLPYQPAWVIVTGWSLGPAFIEHFPTRVIDWQPPLQIETLYNLLYSP